MGGAAVETKAVGYFLKDLTNSTEDPFVQLGPGIYSYFSMIYNLALVFAILTLINIPLMYCYSRYDAYKFDKSSIFTDFTVANMGMAKTKCN